MLTRVIEGLECLTRIHQRVYNDPEVEVLRSHLRQHNGIRGLEVCEPHEIKESR